MAWCITRRVMYVLFVPINSISILGQTIFNGELNLLLESVALEDRSTNLAVGTDMSVSTTLIKVKTTLSSVKFSHNAQLGAHEDDDEGQISLDKLTLLLGFGDSP